MPPWTTILHLREIQHDVFDWDLMVQITVDRGTSSAKVGGVWLWQVV